MYICICIYIYIYIHTYIIHTSKRNQKGHIEYILHFEIELGSIEYILFSEVVHENIFCFLTL